MIPTIQQCEKLLHFSLILDDCIEFINELEIPLTEI